MNRTILILSFSALTFLSCSNDDDTDQTATVKKYPESFILTKDGESTTTKIHYNDQMQITGYTDDYSTISFIYENGRVVKVKENTATTSTDPYGLYYSNGILSRLDHYSESYTVTFNSQQNSYAVGDMLSFGLQEKDIAYVNNINEKENFSYDNSRKGPLYNLTDKDLFPVTLFSTFQYYYLSTKPIATITLNNNGLTSILSSQNTYDNDGYISSMVLKSETEEVFRVEYKYITK